LANSKIIYGDRVLIDLTADTITKDKLLKGYTAHGADGEEITGSCEFDVDSSDVTATVSEVLKGRTFAKGGKILTGDMPINGAMNGVITTKDEQVNIPHGHHDGSGKVAISSTEQAKLIPNNIREGVTILGVVGEMSGSEGMKAQSKTVTPSTVDQDILPDSGYNALSQVTVKAIPYVESDNAAGGKTVKIG
jgi:hypothetical protein